MRRLQILIAGSTMLLLGAATWRYHQIRGEQERGRKILERSLTAGQQINLEGEQRVEVAGSPAVAAHVVRSADGKTHIMYLDGPSRGREVWDNGRLTWRWDPAAKVVAIAASRRGDHPGRENNRELVLRNCVSRLVGVEQVAGEPAFVVDLKPRRSEGPWKRLWVCRRNYAVLGCADFGPDDHKLRSTRFEQVTFVEEPALAASFEPPPDLVERYGSARPGDSPSGFSPRELVNIVRFPVRLPTYLPDGYQLERGYPFPCACRRQAARLQYTNGLNTIIIFECGHICAPGEACVAPKGAASLVVRLGEQGLALAAIGDAPREELARILHSVAHAPPVAEPEPLPPADQGAGPEAPAAGAANPAGR
jgi:hypothetical protein